MDYAYFDVTEGAFSAISITGNWSCSSWVAVDPWVVTEYEAAHVCAFSSASFAGSGATGTWAD